MADPANQFMTEIDKKLKKNELDTAREGNNVTIKGVKKPEDSMTAGQKESMQEAKDEEMRKKMKTAPTTKTEMGKGFAKGGSTSKTPQFKVPIQQLPYMGEKPESRIPPPAQHSKTNSDVKIPDKNYKGGGMTASSRADGCAQRGKTRGKIIK